MGRGHQYTQIIQFGVKELGRAPMWFSPHAYLTDVPLSADGRRSLSELSQPVRVQGQLRGAKLTVELVVA